MAGCKLLQTKSEQTTYEADVGITSSTAGATNTWLIKDTTPPNVQTLLRVLTQ